MRHTKCRKEKTTLKFFLLAVSEQIQIPPHHLATESHHSARFPLPCDSTGRLAGKLKLSCRKAFHSVSEDSFLALKLHGNTLKSHWWRHKCTGGIHLLILPYWNTCWTLLVDLYKETVWAVWGGNLPQTRSAIKSKIAINRMASGWWCISRIKNSSAAHGWFLIISHIGGKQWHTRWMVFTSLKPFCCERNTNWWIFDTVLLPL